MRGGDRAAARANGGDVGKRGRHDGLAVGIGLLLVVGLELAGQMMVLIVLGIAAHPRAQTHRPVLLNGRSRAVNSGAVAAGDAASRSSALSQDIAGNQGTFTVRLTGNLANCNQLLHSDKFGVGATRGGHFAGHSERLMKWCRVTSHYLRPTRAASFVEYLVKDGFLLDPVDLIWRLRCNQ